MLRRLLGRIKKTLYSFYFNLKCVKQECVLGLKMSPLYADRMILQCNKPFRIQGQARSGEWVTVRIAGQMQQTCCRSDGRWEVLLEAILPGGPFRMEVSTPKKQLVYKDVYAGEVWLCSGQSNMAVTMRNYQPENREANNRVPYRYFSLNPFAPTYPGKWARGVNRCVNRYRYISYTGWRECRSPFLGELSAIAYYYGKELSSRLGIPVGLIVNPVGGTAEYCWIERRVLQQEFPEILSNWYENSRVTEWMKERAIENIGKSIPEQEQLHPYHPGYCYEVCIRPIKEYPIRGCIWFAGESSAQLNDSVQFERLQELLIRSWRTDWGECFPFNYVQLHGMNYENAFGKGTKYYYSEIREAQRKLLKKIPYVGMAVSYDLSVEDNVHFKNRRLVGERLARLALHYTYGQKEVVPCGPLYREAWLHDNLIRIKFDFAEGLQTSDGALVQTVEVAGVDGKFYPVAGRIEEEQLLVACPEVQSPCRVHYAFDAYPCQANLVNGDGLPTAAFEIEITQ